MGTISNTNNSVQVNGMPLTTTVANSNSTLLRSEIDNRVAKIRPMSTPIDQLSRCGDVRTAGSMRVQYYSADVKDAYSVLTDEMSRDDFQSGSSGDPNATGILRLRVAKPGIFSETETVLMPDVVINGSPLTVYVTEVLNDSIKGVVVNGFKSFETDIRSKTSAGSRVVRMGRAAGELDVQTSQYETLPKKSENFCQIFKMQIEESTLHRLSNKEAQWGFSDQEEVAIMDMRQGMEKNFLFGIKKKLESVNGKDEIYLTGGIWNQEGVDSFLYSPDEFGQDELISLCRQAFTGGKGSGRKILMGGSGFIERMSKIKTERVLTGTSTLTRWGLEFHEVKTNFGTLFVIHNEIFDQCGHEDDAMVIDPNMITKYVHVPFQAEHLDLRSAGTRNTSAVVVTEASCVVLRNAGCHLRIEALK